MTDNNLDLNFPDSDNLSNLSELVRDALGDSIREPFIAYVGSPIYRFSLYTGSFGDAIYPIPDYDTDLAGMIWAHLPPFVNDDGGRTDSPHFMVLNSGRGAIPDEKLVFGLPIYVIERNGQMMVDGIAGTIGEEFTVGTSPRPQASISLSQFDYALLKPTVPASKRVIVSPSYIVLGNTAYYCQTTITDEFTDTPSIGYMYSYLLELDPVTNTVYSTQSAQFAYDLQNPPVGHTTTFQYYPKTVTAGRVLLGWVRSTGNNLDLTAILQAQEVIGKESAIPSSTTTILNSVLTDNDGSILVDNNGNIISGG